MSLASHYLVPHALRASIAAGKFGIKSTSGACQGYLQANVVVMPSLYAADFEEFCKRNYRACPLLFKSAPGQLDAGPLAKDSDIRDNIPAYEVFRNGIHEERVANIHDIFTNDMVTFYIGCSFSFEEALISSGIPVRNIDQGKNVSMYRTTRSCDAAGPFHGKMVVSMRPIRSDQVSNAVKVTAPYVLAHGSPFHTADANLLLSKVKLDEPDYGDPVEIEDDDVPCFWCCGVTCLEAVKSANLPIVITHSPGCMFVTDVKEKDLFSISDSPILMNTSQSAMQCINSLEYAIKDDPKERNVNAITLPNQLWHACHALASASSVIITTGFPCLIDFAIPTESDGPLGAVMLARTLCLLGKKVTLVVDSANVNVLRACLTRATKLAPSLDSLCTVVHFEAISTSDPSPSASEKAQHLLTTTKAEAVVAIERAGRSSSGHYYTMRARLMDHLVEPIDEIFLAAQKMGIITVGIGDGGNELGMGKVKELVETNIPNGEVIACSVSCDFLISAGVSNWGADALAAGTVVLSPSSHKDAEKLIPDIDTERSLLQACFEAGCRDGVAPSQEMSVDGMLFESEHRAKIIELQAIVCAAIQPKS